MFLIVNIREIIEQGYFKFCFLPIFTILFTIALKYFSKNDRYADGIKKEDFAFGLQISVTALMIFIVYSVSIINASLDNNSSYIPYLISNKEAIPYMILVLLLGIAAMSTIVRKLGWKNANELHWFWGIILPDLLGIFFLFFVFKLIG